MSFKSLGKILKDYQRYLLFKDCNSSKIFIKILKTSLKIFCLFISVRKQQRLLKLVSAIFYKIFIFSLNDCSSKTMKNVFYFILKVLFVLQTFKFLYFFPFLSILPRFKRINSGIIYDVMNWRA